MVDASSPLTFAEKMQRLLRHRAERQPLPAGYMRCPLNPEHQLPIAAIVTHLEKAHQQDALALAPHAMYGTETHTRRRDFLEMQLHRRDGAACRREHANRHHHRRERRRRSRRSSYSSSSSSAASSQSSLPRSRRQRSRRRYRHEQKQESHTSHNGLPVAAYNGIGVPLPPPPPPPPAGAVAAATWCGSYQSAEAAITSAAAPTRTLVGRYTLGFTIDKQCLMSYLLQFGSLLSCDLEPRSASFTVVYETFEAASRCAALSYPSVLIDGVAVKLLPVTSEANVAGASDKGIAVPTMQYVASTYPGTCYASPPPPPPPPTPPPPASESVVQHPHPHSQPPSCTQQTPSVITVGGKPVGLAMLGGGNNCSNASIARGANTKVNPPKCVFIAVLKKTGEAEEMGVDERCLWEEFVRFGSVSSIVVAGPRVVVEYASHESVEKIKQALQKGEEVFTCCSPLQST
ncbi:uncharacterized protein Tco025E_01132 [Trypanosoma conorhini]|uniref:Uncharacterized protein n=1 Tax=Trypanosoma conorhini TaxID=83891 RepID=A0A3R7P013_9TRYP|nr:uncharacterized protein Tco025E_01132 [Trypanosoma conorhini]RNF26600.1 hypothetical protein Tco025E_01132 [Trypanosoma conorhini]